MQRPIELHRRLNVAAFPLILINGHPVKQIEPQEMTNLEYQDGGQSAFPIHKPTSLF